MNVVDLTGRVAVITGGARGVGYAIAERMLASGAQVALWDVDALALEGARAALSARGAVSVETVELTDAEAVKGAAQATLAGHGRVDILVNNAGITGGVGRLWELDPAVWRRVVDVNLTGAFLACRALIPAMLAQDYGRIVNVASIAGKEGNPNASHYSASKAGLIGLTKSLAKELAPSNVLANCVAPGAVKTDLFAQLPQSHIDMTLAKIPLGRFLRVEEAAAMICWLASEECSFSSGAVFDLSGGRATY